MIASAPRVRLRGIELFERPVELRLPFRFGAATVTHCPQAFVRVEAEVDGRPAVGAAAELMVPKWFDKTPSLTHEQNFEQLREALRLARRAYLAEAARQTAYQWSARAGESAVCAARAGRLPRLVAQFGPAQIDKAVADAVLRATGLDWCDGLRAGVLGDPYARAIAIRRPDRVALRHTVGLADRLRRDEPGPDPADGLPATLQDAIAACGLTHFKLKLCGDIGRDLERLGQIAALLDEQAGDYRVTLDGNETFTDAQSVGELWSRLARTAALQNLASRVLLIEQPLPRALALSVPVGPLALPVPLILDESDDHDRALDEGLALGYRGISSKACKGPYRSLRSAARIAGQPGLVLSGEDLTCQAGLAVQQDTLLAASLGVTHIERNGHHYVDGFGHAPAEEAAAFAAAHPGLYRTDGAPHAARVHLQVRGGRLDLRSLHVAGFASATHPRWDSLDAIR